MWSGRANELWPNEVNLGICSHAEVYIIMDHKAGETCFLIFQNVMRYFGRNNKSWKIYILDLIMDYTWIIQDYCCYYFSSKIKERKTWR